jgi:hypothetical protein
MKPAASAMTDPTVVMADPTVVMARLDRATGINAMEKAVARSRRP